MGTASTQCPCCDVLLQAHMCTITFVHKHAVPGGTLSPLVNGAPMGAAILGRRHDAFALRCGTMA
jgi:hypothetical protein